MLDKIENLNPRSPISARLVLDLLEKAGATRIITLDLHNISMQGFSSIPFGLFVALQPFD